MKNQHNSQNDFSKRYYEARGFSVYYFANAVFNIVGDQFSFLRSLEDIFGDTRTQWFLTPFKKYTNLHEFIQSVVESILFEDMQDDEGQHLLLFQFSKTYGLSLHKLENATQESLTLTIAESEDFELAIDSLTDEIFHVLIADISFLFGFNRMLAQYVSVGFVDQAHRVYIRSDGRLKRYPPPRWVRSAVFHRDKGECRSCKKSLAKIINPLDIENYDLSCCRFRGH